ncbi:hypothetical protein TREMEDRAFT_56837, partial [Tremella mesenterica DSM 1558]|uniref:uncharacterized protein n=1 Tax=Tremella mesenterica (strain ATCC 24925 / CBS 8224 / DSM 1558 / NBRC 9311 / NRRL Y-6157 / RJB 2259-6 / UBC 559-6) TaxID=578456 RepID=UPI0003F4A54F
ETVQAVGRHYRSMPPTRTSSPRSDAFQNPLVKRRITSDLPIPSSDIATLEKLWSENTRLRRKLGQKGWPIPSMRPVSRESGIPLYAHDSYWGLTPEEDPGRSDPAEHSPSDVSQNWRDWWGLRSSDGGAGAKQSSGTHVGMSTETVPGSREDHELIHENPWGSS